ncbi:MAG: NAD(P)H-binding protein [Turneriella sp.]|nr:NAD(P)H-binding protein [Turneriella sp.]
MKIFVYGATGTVSSTLVDQLLAAGHEVFAGTRDPQKVAKRERLTPVKIDSAKPNEGVEILEKADAAFLIGPPMVVDSYSALKPLLEKAKAVKLKKIVLMSAIGVDHAPAEAPLRHFELDLEASGLPYNIVRPNWFMQNFHTFWIGGILKDGKIYFPGGDAKASFIDARDIAATVFELLTSDKHVGRAFTLTGPAGVTHAEAAAKLSAATGKKIEYADITSEAFLAGLKSAGLPADYAGFLAYIAQVLKDGHVAAVSGDVKLVTGKDPIAFEQYAADYKAKWL